MRFLPRKFLHRSISFAVILSTVWFVGDTLKPVGLGDIQDPPANAHGPIRKLSRGLSNVMFASTELLTWADLENETLGNAANASPVRGVWRFMTRIGVGLYDILTFPAPTWMGSYGPVEGLLHRSTIPWVNGGFEEFPPELGFETRMPYARVNSATTRLP
jgi:putative exosortase-associated protein (TIGR04073 family)